MFKKKVLYIEVTEAAKDLPLLSYTTEGDAGMDLRAAFPDDVPRAIPPGEWMLVPCGIKIELPRGYEAQVRSRSGLALKHGIAVLNSPGTVDENYRGEVGAILINHDKFPYYIRTGDRIAQLVISKVETVSVVPKLKLSVTKRGGKGFGSSGVN